MLHHLILVALLGHDSFQTRQSATNCLQNDISSYAVVQTATNHQDPEIATRAQRIQASWEQEYVPMWLCRVIGESKELPYIDSIPPSYPNYWTEIAAARSTVNAQQERYYRWWKGEYACDRAATAAFLWEHRNEPVEDLQKLFKKMQERSKFWDDNDHKWPTDE